MESFASDVGRPELAFGDKVRAIQWGLVLLIAAGLIDVRYWFRSAYWIYGASLVLIIAVDLLGTAGLGAQRWIDLGVMQLQPSELMKIALVLALARHFHSLSSETT